MKKQGNVITRRIDEAIALYGEGKYTQSLTQLLACTPGTPSETTDISYYAGLCYMQLKRYEDSLVYLEQVVTSGTSLERVRQCRLLLAVIYALTGRERLADFELKKLLDTGYKTASVYSALAYIAWEQKKTNEALVYYETALKEDEACVTAVNGMGYVLAADGKDLTRALSLCKRAVEMAPSSPACLDSLGWVYYKMGLLQEAKTCLKKAKERDSDCAEIQSHYTIVLTEEKAARENTRITEAVHFDRASGKGKQS
jgi:tetratricopeptide (TPR) repeat protein